MGDLSNGWSNHAKSYGEYFDPFTSSFSRAAIDLAMNKLGQTGEKGKKMTFLDVACGGGAITIPLAHRLLKDGREFSIHATDYAQGMIDLVEASIRKEKLDHSIQSSLEDGQELSFTDDSFDAVSSFFGIFLFPRRSAGWSEAHRVLKKGGVFVTTSWNLQPDAAFSPEDENEKNFMRSLFMALAKSLPEELRPKKKPSWQETSDPAILKKELVDAGFSTVVVHRAYSSVCASVEGIVEGLLENPAAQMMFQKATPDVVNKLRNDLIHHMSSKTNVGNPCLWHSIANIAICVK